MLLAGLWCSNQKPPMLLYLRPIAAMLKMLECKGT